MTKMKSLSSVGLGLSVVFGCLFLALIAELYYLLWWKKRFTHREVENDYSSNPQKEIFYTFCWRRTSSKSPRDFCAALRMTDTLVHEPNNAQQLKQFDEDEELDAELMRLQNAAGGPPRHLFTIVEETKEDLESEGDGGTASQKGSRSLSELLVRVDETPYLTPLGSPTLFTPPLTPVDHHRGGFNHLFESKSDAEFNRLRSSPPPKFKFLQVAEEKLRNKLMAEADQHDGSFITIIVDNKKERELNYHHNHHYHSTTSQILPLASSPSSAFPSQVKKKPNSH